MKLGLTGGAGSGKSEAAKIFSALGVTVIDADAIAHQLLRPQEACYHQVVKHFGQAICQADATIDRQLLRKKMIEEPAAKQALEAILHPVIRKKLIAASQALNQNETYSLIVVPLLLESGMMDIVDRILVINCPEGLRQNVSVTVIAVALRKHKL